MWVPINLSASKIPLKGLHFYNFTTKISDWQVRLNSRQHISWKAIVQRKKNKTSLVFYLHIISLTAFCQYIQHSCLPHQFYTHILICEHMLRWDTFLMKLMQLAASLCLNVIAKSCIITSVNTRKQNSCSFLCQTNLSHSSYSWYYTLK